MNRQDELINELLQDIEGSIARLRQLQSLQSGARLKMEEAEREIAALAAAHLDITNRLAALQAAGTPFFTDERVKDAAERFSDLFSSLAADTKATIEPKVREAAEKLNEAVRGVDFSGMTRKARENAAPFFASVVEVAKRGAKQVADEARDITVSRTINRALEDAEQGVRSFRNVLNAFMDGRKAASDDQGSSSTKSWSSSSDVVVGWLNGYRADDLAQILVSQAHLDYATFCEKNGHPALTQRDFLKVLSDLRILVRTVETSEGEEVQVLGLRSKG